MKPKRLIIGSRASKLAMTQTHCVTDKLKEFYPDLDFEIRTIKTVGDKILDVALSKVGDKGLFTKEIEEALLRREIDFAVHSMKDLPTQLPQELEITAVPVRENSCDVLVSKQGFTIRTLPKNAKIGTSSLRRQAQLLNKRADLKILDLRGNVDTRIKKLEQGLYDAIILAYAGIKRLGLKLELSEISTDDMLPQAGQGALGIEVHKDSQEVKELLSVLDDADSHLSVDAERALIAGLEGGCQVPIGVCAKIKGDSISIRAGLFSLDGRQVVRDEIQGKKKDSRSLGKQLAEKILRNNVAKQILSDVRNGLR